MNQSALIIGLVGLGLVGYSMTSKAAPMPQEIKYVPEPSTGRVVPVASVGTDKTSAFAALIGGLGSLFSRKPAPASIPSSFYNPGVTLDEMINYDLGDALKPRSSVFNDDYIDIGLDRVVTPVIKDDDWYNNIIYGTPAPTTLDSIF
jgi:hypothetical protein